MDQRFAEKSNSQKFESELKKDKIYSGSPMINLNQSNENNDTFEKHLNKEKKNIETENKNDTDDELKKNKTFQMILLDEKNNILTKKYSLIMNLNKKILKMPFNLEPYKINFTSIQELSKQFLNKLKTNDLNDINHYENLSSVLKLGFYNEYFKKIVTDDDIINEENSILVCKFEYFKNDIQHSIINNNKFLDLALFSNKSKKTFDLEKSNFSSSPNQGFMSRKASENNLNKINSSNHNNLKYPPIYNKKEYDNKDITLNNYMKQQKNSFFEKVINFDQEIHNNGKKIFGEGNPNDESSNNNYKENKLNISNSKVKDNVLYKSDSDSYILTNRSFYSKIKPKNVEIITRDSEKKSKEIKTKYSTSKTVSKFDSYKKSSNYQSILSESIKKNVKKFDEEFNFQLNGKVKNFTIQNDSNNNNQNKLKFSSIVENTIKTSDQNNLLNKKLVEKPIMIKEDQNIFKLNFDNLKIKTSLNSFNINENSYDIKDVKLPTIFSKSSKYDDHDTFNTSRKIIKENSSEKPKFVNYFENKKEAKNLFRSSLIAKKIRISNETQTSPSELTKKNYFKDHPKVNRFYPNISNSNSNNFQALNSHFNSFEDKSFNKSSEIQILNDLSKYNSNLCISDNENDSKNKASIYKKLTDWQYEMKKKKSNSPNKLLKYFSNRMIPAKLLIKKNYDKKFEDNIYTENLDTKTNFKNLTSNIDLKLKFMQKQGSKFLKNSLNDSNESIYSIYMSNKLKNDLKKSKKVKALQNLLNIENNQFTRNSQRIIYINNNEVSNNMDINDNNDCDNTSSNKNPLKKNSSSSVLNKFSENPIENNFSIKMNNKSTSFMKEDKVDSRKTLENKKSLKKDKNIGKNKNHKSDFNNQNNISNLSDNTSYLNRSLISEYEGEFRFGNKTKVSSDTEKEKFENELGKQLNEKKTRNVYNNTNENYLAANKKKNPFYSSINSCNFSCGVNLSEEKNYENYYINLFENIQNVKAHIDIFIRNDLIKLISNDLIDEKFKGIVYHEKSEFDYLVKKEFLFYAFISSKFEEKISFKTISQKNFGLPVPGGEYRIVHTGKSSISIKINRNESEINYDIFRKSKKNYLKLLQEYNIIIFEIIQKVKKNISELHKYFITLNCLKIHNLYIDFHFTNIYIFRNENLFADRKIIFKLLELLSKDNNYLISFDIFYKLRQFSTEEINELSLENFNKHINFICRFLKFYIKDLTEKEEINKYIEKFKISLNINEFDFSLFIAEDISDLMKNGKTKNYRLKVANIYLSLIKLLI